LAFDIGKAEKDALARGIIRDVEIELEPMVGIEPTTYGL